MITTDNVLQFARASAARHEVITAEIAALRVLIEMADTAESVLDERQAQIDKERAELARKREQLRTWSESLNLLRDWISEEMISKQIEKIGDAQK